MTTNSSKASFWIRLNRHIIRLCSSHQFENLQVRNKLKETKDAQIPIQCIHFQEYALHFKVEMLYQRYFLRMNQSNTTHILSLLLALVLSLAAVHIILIPMESTSHKTLQRNRYNDTVNSNGSNISATLNRSDNIAYYTPNPSSQQHFVRNNYNYSTDNETGNWLYVCIICLNQNPYFVTTNNSSCNGNGNGNSN